MLPFDKERFEKRTWVIEERLALVPLLGKLAARGLPRGDHREEILHYGAHPEQYLILARPGRSAPRRQSAVLFLHGGGWRSGSPRLYRWAGQFFAEQGFPTLVVGYRLAPAAKFPAQLDDVRDGLAAGLGALNLRGVPVERVIAGGISAGAHLSALLVYGRDANGLGPIRPELFAGFFSICGPLSFAACTSDALQEMLTDLIADPVDWERADPIWHLRGDETTPALFIHGRRDPLVDVANTIAFSERLKAGGRCPVDVRLIPGGHHADLAALFVDDLPITRTFRRWLDKRDRDGAKPSR